MSDLIDRQAAIDAVYKCTDIFINNLPVMVDKADAYKALAALPPAQPEITDEQAIEHLQSTGWMQSHDRILTQSTWDIIRCKDCKFYIPMNRETKSGICDLTMHQNFGDDWFCAGAERRTDE